jgi:Nucleotidyl transferase
VLIKNFNASVLKDYQASLNVFFDPATGGVLEPGREDGAPKFLFTEVTGYALLDFLTLHALTGDDQYLARTRQSADWIMNHGQDSTGGILTRFYFEHDGREDLAYTSFSGRRIYAFDTGICLRGMVAAYKALGTQAYLDSARRMADFMLTEMIDEHGNVEAIFDAKAGKLVAPDTNVWSRAFGAFLTKVAEALIDLHEVTGAHRYRDVAIAICDASIQFQGGDGNIQTSAGRTELHPHCYATEGFLHVGRMTGIQRYIDVARRATEWALRNCENGEIAQSFEFPSSKPSSRFRTDALAQVLALGSDLRQMGQLDLGLESRLDDLAAKVLSMKTGSPAYYRYGFYERVIGGKHEADTRSYWTNMFCLRGLHKYYVSYLVGNANVAILAGGIGSRVWPISCENRPKPVSMSLLGDRSLLQETIRRFRHDLLIPAERIYILCSRNALAQVIEQASAEGIPETNCVLEHVPKGTIPAVNLACAGMPPADDPAERMVVVSMADNVIEPYHKFQNALISALMTARENDVLISIGRPVPASTKRDDRFGHMKFQRSIDNYRTYEVERFAEKPDEKTFNELMSMDGDLAWESGCVVFKEEYFRSVVPMDADSGNLAEHLLCRAAPWSEQSATSVRVAVAVMDPGVRFEDFGVPGQNMISFYAGHPKYDRGHGNICVGAPERVRMVASSNNLVIADQLPIEIYGIEGFVVIDNEVTNTTVVIKLQDVPHLPSLYRLFLGSKDYEAFVAGGPRALTATPTSFVERSPNARSSCDFGLVFAFNFQEHLSIERTRNGLRITNTDLPALSPKDFNVFVEKQNEDPMLVEHLVRVGALAKSLAQDDLVLSRTGNEVLSHLSLYHAFGGYLTQAAEAQEKAALFEFKQVSNLDVRLLDSRVVVELMRLARRNLSDADQEVSRLIAKNVNSAVEFLAKRQPEDKRLRDLTVGLLQVQNSPSAFQAFRRNLKEMGYGEVAEEIERVFACFKLAQHICNGRWFWKRNKNESDADNRPWFLEHQRGPLEEIPFIAAFTQRWLLDAGIDPSRYLDRMHQLLATPTSTLRRLLTVMQDGLSDPLADGLYLQLVNCVSTDVTSIQPAVLKVAQQLLSEGGGAYQWRQLMELPVHLKALSSSNPQITIEKVDAVREALLEFYHANWRALKGLVAPELISE